ncbi:MAG: hypothetical protein QG588_215 [Candidatus Poribacteria bacterium]|nr:hypothetical protein [Candidatus Poribacteria bacterium]
MGMLYYGDNLEILRNKIKDETINLCYIDPPFNSKRSYFQIYNNIGREQDKTQAQAFVDTWKWDTYAIEGHQQIINNFEGRFTRQSIELIRGLELTRAIEQEKRLELPLSHEVLKTAVKQDDSNSQLKIGF